MAKSLTSAQPSPFTLSEIIKGKSASKIKSIIFSLSQTGLGSCFGHEIWGIAVDDAHDILGPDFNKGWIQLYADKLTSQTIRESLLSGNFYSSQSPMMNLSVNNKTILVSTDSPSTIKFIIQNGDVAKTEKNTKSGYYKTNGNELYIRVFIIRDSDGKKAWSNPVFVREGL